jgi:hypothetical protein
MHSNVGVSVPCSTCGAPVEVQQVRCACGRFVTREVQDALERRFEASNAEYAEAKGTAVKALAVALVVGLFTIAIGIVRYAAAMSTEIHDEVRIAEPLIEVAGGVVLVVAWFYGKREPLPFLVIAIAQSLVSFVTPFVVAKASALLQFASPLGVAVTLARVGVLLLLFRGVSAASRQRRLLRLPRLFE